MEPERWRKVEQIFDAVLKVDESRRAGILAQCCAGDESLREEVESLLRHHSQANSFLEHPAFAFDSTRSAAISRALTENGGLGSGAMVAHYRIEAKLGEGGMGLVYRAWDTRLHRTVALKFVSRRVADMGALERLRTEARAASGLNHPNICTVYDLVESGRDCFISMEFVEGRTLDLLIPPRGLPTAEVLHYGRQMADALSHAHEHGVLHRDIKPANMIVTANRQLKVLDFGIAQKLSAAEVEEVTRSLPAIELGKTLAGTLPYISPEVLAGKEAGYASDVWSFGVVLCEMATGRRPFNAATVYETTSAILGGEPPPLPPIVPNDLRAIVGRCLEKDPSRRFQRAREVHAALDRTHIDADRAQQPKSVIRQRWRLLGGAGLGICVLFAIAFLSYLGAFRERIAGKQNSQAIRSVAVLPLINLSGDPEQQYFADGMTEELTTGLAQISSLRVVSRTSAMRYRQPNRSVPEIAKDLGVDAVIEGSVERDHSKVRISAQMIDGHTDTHLWAHSYLRNMTDMLALQDEVTGAIVNEIKVKLTPQEQVRLRRHRSVDPIAYDSYLKGLAHLVKRTGPDEKQAVADFTDAIQRDPDYADAFVALSDAYRTLAFNSNSPPLDVFPKSIDAANRALGLDPDSAEAHATLGLAIATFQWDWPKAESELKTALQLNPNSVAVHLSYASLLTDQKRYDESMQEVQKALEIDPLNPIAKFYAGMVSYMGRHYDVAEVNLRQALELGNFWPSHLYLGKTLAKKGEFEQAVTELRQAGNFTAEPLATLGYVYARMGRRDEAFRVISELKRRANKGEYIAPTHIAKIYAGLGDKEQAIAWLQKAYEVRDTWLTFMSGETIWDPLRSDPRFQSLLRKIGIPN